MRRITAALLLLALGVAVCALAEEESWVAVRRNTGIYAAPDASGEPLTGVNAGAELEYTGKTQQDAAGRQWYSVSWKGVTGWISGADAELTWATLY